MKRVGMSLLSLVLAAVILGAGYAAVALSDRWFAPDGRVTQMEKDSEQAAVRRLDGGVTLALYPFDEKQDSACVPLYESALFDRAWALWYETTYPLEEVTAEGHTERREEYAWTLNYQLCARLDRLFGTITDFSLTENAPHLLDAVVYQERNDMCYVQDLPLWVTQNGVVQSYRLTVAFRLAYEVEDLVVHYFSLLPELRPEVEAPDQAALEQTAAALIEQCDRLLADAAWEGPAEAPDEATASPVFLRRFFQQWQLSTLSLRESVIYGDEVWIVLQNFEIRVVLQYAPALERFYGISYCVLE